MRHTLSLLIACGLASPALAQCETLWTNAWSGNFLFRSSRGPAVDAEAADDIEIHNTIHRVVATGRGYAVTDSITGAWVRLYNHTPAGPGDLFFEVFVSSSDPGFVYNPQDPQDLDITLPTPIALDGTYFISVQAQVTTAGWWEFWQANQRNAWGQHLWVRDNQAGGVWEPYIDPIFPPNELHSDLNITVFGGHGDPVGATGDWRVVPTPSPTQLRAVVRDLSVRAHDDVWISGESDLPDHNWIPMILHYDGSDWTVFPDITDPGDPDFYDYQFYGVAAPAPDEVWFAGAKGSAALETWLVRYDGDTFETISTPSSPPQSSGSYLYDVIVVDDTVWTAGSFPRDFLIYSLNRSGGGGTLHDVPELGGLNRITELSASGPDDVWAMGGWTPGRPALFNLPYLIHYNGSSWSLVMPIINSSYRYLTDVLAVSPTDVWVAGYVGTPARGITVHFNGTTWTQHEAPAPIGSFAKSPDGHVYAASSQDLLRWSGSEWEVVDSFGCVEGSASLLEIAPDGAIWGAGNQAIAGFTQPLVASFFPSGAACPADFSGASDPNDPAYGVPDGVADASDFFFYLDLFNAGDLFADLSGSSDPSDPAYGAPDGLLDASDFFFYLDIFVAGCP